MRGARYVRLISWTLQSGSEQELPMTDTKIKRKMGQNFCVVKIFFQNEKKKKKFLDQNSQDRKHNESGRETKLFSEEKRNVLVQLFCFQK
jgi:hypothetical protein